MDSVARPHGKARRLQSPVRNVLRIGVSLEGDRAGQDHATEEASLREVRHRRRQRRTRGKFITLIQ